MRDRWSALAFLAAVALVLAACGSGPTSTPAPAATPATEVPTRLVPTTRLGPTTTVRPRPIAIPEDSYAREKVVELGAIEIPAIGLQHKMFQGVTLHNIDKGPSHWTGTALPGERGNTVIAGHRVTYSHPFERIDELQAGDEVILRVAGRRSVYRVTTHQIVTPDDLWIADQTDTPTGTLYACHPPGSYEFRYVVRMELSSTGPDY